MYLFFAILANLLNSIALTVDKFLITKVIPDPLVYVFYFSLISFVALLGIPFTQFPSSQVFILASTSTLSWTLGAYLMFWALKTGQVQRVVPVIGTIIPLILLAISSITGGISPNQTVAVLILVLGLVFLTFQDLRGRLLLKELFLEVLSAIFFALAYLMLREAFLKQDFLTVLIWSRPVLLPLGVVIILIPKGREIVLSVTKQGSNLKKAGLLFVGGQISAGVSELLLLFAISLANPTLVNSLQGTKYVFLLIFAFILGKKYPDIFKRQRGGWQLLTTILGIILIGAGLAFLAFKG